MKTNTVLATLHLTAVAGIAYAAKTGDEVSAVNWWGNLQLLAPIATLIAALISAYMSWRTTQQTRQNQIDLAEINAKIGKSNALLLKHEERLYLLRSDRLSTLYSKLEEVVKQSHVLMVNIDQIAKLPYPENVLKILLIESGEVGSLQQVILELARLRLVVLLAIHTDDVEGFSLSINDVVVKGMTLGNHFLVNPMSQEKVAEYRIINSEFRLKLAGLIRIVRELIRKRAEEVRDEGKLTDQSLSNWLSAALGAQVKAGNPTPSPYFLAMWNIGGLEKDDHDEFLREFDRVSKLLSTQTIPGLVKVTAENESQLSERRVVAVLMLVFSSNKRLSDYLEILPAIKEQTRIIWADPLAPEIRAYAVP